MYIHSVYKDSPRHYLSIEIKDHNFWKFKTHLYNHHSSKPGHITAKRTCKSLADHLNMGIKVLDVKRNQFALSFIGSGYNFISVLASSEQP